MSDVLPDFIGIGAQKSATSWIDKCLREHPDICMPRTVDGSEKKELRFFDRNFDRGYKYYHQYFSHCASGKTLGEVTPVYLYKQQVAERIYEWNPDVKLIVSVRNPIERAISQYTAKAWLLNITFEQALQQSNDYLEKGLYAKHLRPFLERFPRENVYITVYDDIAANPTKFIQQIYRFLGVDAAYEPSGASIRRNVSQGFMYRFQFMADARSGVARRLRAVPRLKKALLQTGLKQLDRQLLWQNTVPSDTSVQPTLTQAQREQLRAYFDEDIRELEYIIDRNLSSWK